MPRRGGGRQQSPPSKHPHHDVPSPPPSPSNHPHHDVPHHDVPSRPPSPSTTCIHSHTDFHIHSNADLQTLKARSDEIRARLAHPNNCISVFVESLESVRIARESFALLLPLIEPRLRCPELDLLSYVAGIALELHKVENDLLPRLLLPEAKLEGAVLDALLHLKNSGTMLMGLGKDFEELYGRLLGSLGDDLISARVKNLGLVLRDAAVYVLTGVCKIESLKERDPGLLELVNTVLATPVHFL